MRKLDRQLHINILLVLIGLMLISIWVSTSVFAEDFYPSIVLLNLKSENKIINQEPFFEILDYDDYILLPLSALSRYLELELDYNREEDRLFIYYPETEARVEVDFKREIYPDFPEWNNTPPYIYEGDFYVCQELIEHITGGNIDWLPRRQEVNFEYEDSKISEEEEEIPVEERPETTLREPDVLGPRFSLGSLQYKAGLTYLLAPQQDFSEGSLYSKNKIYLHGQAGNWAVSLGQNVNYDFQNESFQVNFPLISAINRENNRLVMLGDYNVNFKNTRVNENLRGIYVQYPQRQLLADYSFTSVKGEAEPGSKVLLFLNGDLIAEQYIYKSEKTYHFSRIRLVNRRTNILEVVIKDKEGQVVDEIKEKISGSSNVYEDSVQQYIFLLGQVREDSNNSIKDYLGGLQAKYAFSKNSSLFWEIVASREEEKSGDYGVPIAHLLRFAHRTEWPLVLTFDWLAGGDIKSEDNYNIHLIEHGARFNALYTLDRGYISADLDYVPPYISEFVLADTGGRIGLSGQHQLNNSWLLNMSVDTVTSIKDMPDMEIYRGKLGLKYRGLNRTSLNLETEYGQRDQINFWQQINAYESDKEWLSIFAGGKTKILKTDLSGDFKYKIDRINFLNTENSIRFETADIKLDTIFQLSDNIKANMQVDSTTKWLESSLYEQSYNLDTRIRRGTENSIFTLGFNNENNRLVDSEEVNFEENRREMYAEIRYFPNSDLTLTGELRDTYLYLFNDNFLTAKAGINYVNRNQNWRLELEGSYRTPIGTRETPQEEVTLELTKDFSSGQRLTLSANRKYNSFYQNEPSYNISFNLSQSLNFVKNKIIGRQYTGANHRSKIMGVVYLDEQGNGVRDDTDPLLSDITLYREGARTVTNEQGEFTFNNVRSGLHEVGINLDNLSAKYDIITQEKIVKIRENENIYLEFGVTMSGTVSGRVFVDPDMNGEYEKGDEPIATIGLEIEKLNKRVYTRSDGTFYFEKIPLGTYIISVLPDTLPANMRVFGEEKFKVLITEDDLDIRGIDIPLVYGSRK